MVHLLGLPVEHNLLWGLLIVVVYPFKHTTFPELFNPLLCCLPQQHQHSNFAQCAPWCGYHVGSPFPCLEDSFQEEVHTIFWSLCKANKYCNLIQSVNSSLDPVSTDSLSSQYLLAQSWGCSRIWFLFSLIRPSSFLAVCLGLGFWFYLFVFLEPWLFNPNRREERRREMWRQILRQAFVAL